MLWSSLRFDPISTFCMELALVKEPFSLDTVSGLDWLEWVVGNSLISFSTCKREYLIFHSYSQTREHGKSSQNTEIPYYNQTTRIDISWKQYAETT